MIIGIGLTLRATLFGSTAVSDPYEVAGFSPPLVFDFAEEFYRTGGSTTTFDAAMTHSRAGNATMVDSDGVLKWAPHNLALNSATPATQSITSPLIIVGAKYTVECTGVSIALSGAGTGTATEGNPVEITASTTTLTLTVTGSTGTMWAYRSDIGGMVDNPDTGNSYVPTTSAARYLPRRRHHIYNGSAWVNAWYLHESEARTNLLLNSGTLATQNVTVTAVPHTLHFTGTGTVTLSGASTAGPLVGTGTGENNRVSLTFTPTAGTLTVTVTGTVTNADLEVGSTLSSHKPTSGSTVTRAADTITVPYANLPWPTTNVIGEELVTNGTFDTDSDWTLNTGATISGGTLNLTPPNTAGDAATQAISGLVAGRVYRATFSVVSRASGSYKFIVRNAANTITVAELTAVSPGDYERFFVATGTGQFLRSQFVNTNTEMVIDNISVREIDPLSVSIQMDGKMTTHDASYSAGKTPVRWSADANNQIRIWVDGNAGVGLRWDFDQEANNVIDQVSSASGTTDFGINVPYNIASRHGSTFINGAVDGTALTANTTPTALPDLSATNLQLGYDYMGCIRTFRMWANDLGDTGIAEASA